MGISLSDQTAYFMWSLALGLAIGAAYDLVRAIRMLTRAGRTHVLISDVVFFALIGVVTSLFALPFNKGDVRGFIIFGESVGFCAYRMTVGSIMGKFYSHLTDFLRTIIQKIHKNFEFFFELLLKMTHALVYNIHEVVDRLRSSASDLHNKHRAGRAEKSSPRGAAYKERSDEQKKRNKAKARCKRKNRRQRKRHE